MASERAMVEGSLAAFSNLGTMAGVLRSISELQVLMQSMGEQPVACAPKNFTSLPSTRPSLISSSKAFLILTISEPPPWGRLRYPAGASRVARRFRRPTVFDPSA